MICRRLILILPLISSAVQAQVGVPVQDAILNSTVISNNERLVLAVGNSSTQISAQIDNSSKALSQQQDEINRQNAEREALRFTMEQKRLNAERHSVSFGAKVKDACAIVKGSRELHRGQIAKQKITKLTVAASNTYLERGRYRSPNEPAATAEAASLLTRFKNIDQFAQRTLAEETEKSMIDNGLSLSTKPDANGNTQYDIEWQRINALLSPFADNVPENYDDPKQPAADLVDSAHAKWKYAMNQATMKNAALLQSNKANVISDSWADYMFANTDAGKQMKALAVGDGGAQSYYSTLEVMNKARLFSADWIAYTNNDMTDRALKADANIMLAQMLVNMQETNRLLLMIAEGQHLSFANDMRYFWGNDSTSTAP